MDGKGRGVERQNYPNDRHLLTPVVYKKYNLWAAKNREKVPKMRFFGSFTAIYWEISKFKLENRLKILDIFTKESIMISTYSHESVSEIKRRI